MYRQTDDRYAKGGEELLFLGPLLPILAMTPSFAELRYAFTKVTALEHFGSARRIRLKKDASGLAIVGIILRLCKCSGILQ